MLGTLGSTIAASDSTLVTQGTLNLPKWLFCDQVLFWFIAYTFQVFSGARPIFVCLFVGVKLAVVEHCVSWWRLFVSRTENLVHMYVCIRLCFCSNIALCDPAWSCWNVVLSVCRNMLRPWDLSSPIRAGCLLNLLYHIKYAPTCQMMNIWKKQAHRYLWLFAACITACIF